MPTGFGSRVALGMAMAGAAAPAVAAQVPTIAISQGAKELTEPFSSVAGLLELRDGRLLVHDSRERELLLVDFTRDTQTPAARQGAGPLEFNSVGTLLRGAADSAVYYDTMQRRFLVFTPAGAPTRTTAFGGTDPLAMLTLPRPTDIDAAGRVYGQTMGMRLPASGLPGPNDNMFADTVAVLRIDFRGGKTDTVARIVNEMARSQPRMEMTGGTMKMTVTAPDARANDAWAALPDGRVAVLRNGEYRVRFVGLDGRETLGPPVPYTPIPITADMKRAAMDSIRAALPNARAVAGRAAAEAGARAGAAISMPNVDFDVREPAQWATHLAPWSSLRASPDGRLWVTVPSAIEGSALHHDVLDANGRLIARVTFPRGESLIGFGRGTAYTIRRDEDDLQYLRRYPLPAPIATPQEP